MTGVIWGRSSDGKIVPFAISHARLPNSSLVTSTTYIKICRTKLFKKLNEDIPLIYYNLCTCIIEKIYHKTKKQVQ